MSTQAPEPVSAPSAAPQSAPFPGAGTVWSGAAPTSGYPPAAGPATGSTPVPGTTTGSTPAPGAWAGPRSASQFTAPYRELVAAVLLGFVAILHFIGFLDMFVVFDNWASDFPERANRTFEGFVGLVQIGFPLLAVLLVTHFLPPTARAKLVTIGALVLYGVSALFGLLLLFAGFLGRVTVEAEGAIRTAFESLLIRLGWLAVLAVAALLVFRVYHGMYMAAKPKPAHAYPQQPGYPGAAAAQAGYPAAQAGYPAAQAGYPAAQAGYPAQGSTGPGYPAAHPGYAAAQPGYSAAQPGYPAQLPGYSTQGGYSGQTGGYPAQAGQPAQTGYSPQAGGGYPAQAGSDSTAAYPQQPGSGYPTAATPSAPPAAAPTVASAPPATQAGYGAPTSSPPATQAGGYGAPASGPPATGGYGAPVSGAPLSSPFAGYTAPPVEPAPSLAQPAAAADAPTSGAGPATSRSTHPQSDVTAPWGVGEEPTPPEAALDGSPTTALPPSPLPPVVSGDVATGAGPLPPVVPPHVGPPAPLPPVVPQSSPPAGPSGPAADLPDSGATQAIPHLSAGDPDRTHLLGTPPDDEASQRTQVINPKPNGDEPTQRG